MQEFLVLFRCYVCWELFYQMVGFDYHVLNFFRQILILILKFFGAKALKKINYTYSLNI